MAEKTATFITSLAFKLAPIGRRDSPSLISTMEVIVRSSFLTCILILGLVSTAHATPKCSARAEGSASYVSATEVVRQLPEYRAWSSTHPFPVAFGTPVDEEVLVKGKCYWSVSVYADRPERFELWHIFYVRLSSRTIFVQDSEGEPISLKRWRMRNKVDGINP